MVAREFSASVVLENQVGLVCCGCARHWFLQRGLSACPNCGHSWCSSCQAWQR
ncbi:hypothetical protein BU16DRAFT_526026 [Lophium mytilinum]|uniref:Uncharacterized protein n=1 Tax=Lophium mytilinum TaxID=390894 RepID=A0A6A6QYX5_9PEZI|nr:hypothetical protein BU16DRAFT_526026 [Lophium mytilinum]